MHRAQPTASKLCESKNRERAYQLHLQKLKSIKSTVNTKPPKPMPHLKRNMKKLQMEQENFEKIKYENQLLLNKMTDIMEKKYIDNENENAKYVHSLNREYRKKELMRITKENQAILKRIQRKQPFYNRLDWERERIKNEKYLQNICEYPPQVLRDSMGRMSLQSQARYSQYPENRMESYAPEQQQWEDEPNDNEFPSNEDVDDLIDQVDKQLEEAGLKDDNEESDNHVSSNDSGTQNEKTQYRLKIISATGISGDDVEDSVYVSVQLASGSTETAYEDFKPLQTQSTPITSEMTWNEEFGFESVNTDDSLIFTVCKASTNEIIESVRLSIQDSPMEAENNISLNAGGVLSVALYNA